MEKTRLGRLLFLKFILLYYQCDVEGCQVTVKQEKYKESHCWKTITLSCNFTTNNCSRSEQEISWFRYLASGHENLSRGGNWFNLRSNGDYQYLEIKNVSVQDSGIYICGITYKHQEPTSQNIGQGTTLVVIDENDKITAGNTSLIVICTLLFVYCVTVFTYYAYKSKWKICKLKQDASMSQTHKSYKTRQIFQAIAQEYHKRYDGKTRKQNQVIEDDTIYQNTTYTN